MGIPPVESQPPSLTPFPWPIPARVQPKTQTASGPLLSHSRAALGHPWTPLEELLGPLGPLLGGLGELLGPPRPQLGRSWVPLGRLLGRSWLLGSEDRFGTYFGPRVDFGSILDHPEIEFGAIDLAPIHSWMGN